MVTAEKLWSSIVTCYYKGPINRSTTSISATTYNTKHETSAGPISTGNRLTGKHALINTKIFYVANLRVITLQLLTTQLVQA